MDKADKLSCRPDFTVLVYPAFLSVDGVNLSKEITVSSDTPPAFIVQAEDDKAFVASSTAYYLGLAKADVPCELHIFPRGGHGYGLRRTKETVACWPDLCETWLKGEGVIRDVDASENTIGTK